MKRHPLSGHNLRMVREICRQKSPTFDVVPPLRRWFNLEREALVRMSKNLSIDEVVDQLIDVAFEINNEYGREE